MYQRNRQPHAYDAYYWHQKQSNSSNNVVVPASTTVVGDVDDADAFLIGGIVPSAVFFAI
jgi:hypothetical protein